MADSFELAYLYARICGAFSSMNLGAKGADLARESSLSSIWKLYFEEEIPDKPEAWLLATLEKRVLGRSIDRFLALANPVMGSDGFINALVAKYEISVIKNMLQRIAESEAKPEATVFSNERIQKALSAWPRLKDMFSGTIYDWVDEGALADIGITESRLDKQYYTRLWNSASELPRGKLGNIPALILREIEYQNLAWALRVRRYYGYGRER
ncbi:MAG: V-type ATPase subunit, partial [Spirochaetales bacterium]